MAKVVDFSIKRFLILFAIIVIGALVIAFSDQSDLHINWKIIANTVLIAAILLRLSIWGFSKYRSARKPDQLD